MKLMTWMVAAALASLGAHASTPLQELRGGRGMPRPDLLPRKTMPPPMIDIRRLAAPAAMAGAAPTVDEVGDIASFGRSLRWLGVQQMNIDLLDTCPPGPVDGFACQPLAPAPATTSFEFHDVARFVLPAKASKSILCHWFSPWLSLAYDNPTAAPQLATLTYSPTLTVENPLLDDPALINPQTGLPFAGRLETAMSSSERIVVPLAPGMAFDERRRDTATCIAGFVSKRGLVENYGLNEAQADEFFKQPMVVRMNIRGSAAFVASAQLIFGLRIIGD